METFSALLGLCEGGHRWIPLIKGQWHGALMFYLICAWTNGWVNTRDAGDLRHHRAHYDVIIIIYVAAVVGRLFAQMKADGWKRKGNAKIETNFILHNKVQNIISFYEAFHCVYKWYIDYDDDDPFARWPLALRRSKNTPSSIEYKVYTYHSRAVTYVYPKKYAHDSRLNSLWPSDAIWRWRSWSTLIQVMACCLTAPSHYLNQCWLIISKVLWLSSEDIIIRFEDTNQ